MNKHKAGVFLLLLWFSNPGFAHPGSGIVVGEDHSVYFADTGFGVWKLSSDLKLQAWQGPAWHWLSQNRPGQFTSKHNIRVPEGDIKVIGENPGLISSSSFPVTVGVDGAVYYPEVAPDETVQIMKLEISGRKALFAKLPAAEERGAEGKRIKAKWVHGLAADDQGAIYYTERYAIRRISKEGKVAPFSKQLPPAPPERNPLLKEEHFGPAFYGLDVASDGTVYVAASAWCAVVAIKPQGESSIVLQSQPPWAPTGVAVRDGSLYVLEYLHIPTTKREDWLPRVRKIDPTGTVSLLTTVEEATRQNR